MKYLYLFFVLAVLGSCGAAPPGSTPDVLYDRTMRVCSGATCKTDVQVLDPCSQIDYEDLTLQGVSGEGAYFNLSGSPVKEGGTIVATFSCAGWTEPKFYKVGIVKSIDIEAQTATITVFRWPIEIGE